MGTSCFTCQGPRATGVRGQLYSNGVTKGYSNGPKDGDGNGEGQGGKGAGGKERKECGSPNCRTKGTVHSSFDCHPVPPSACLRLGTSVMGTLKFLSAAALTPLARVQSTQDL